ncbi:hypothetical protein LUX57_39395 [Actinomadura madurae]|uniref:hypothetical protein n=1 Tax=Actinomadura madurae TaxID=1993 RepID=UPI0020D237FF|nr:hypothetical protein [Actinomadura madurae]MCP9970501.1 hypothetical protein [Actinomadura madurae]
MNRSSGSSRRFDTGTSGPEAGAICGVSGTIGGSATCGPVMPASGSKPDAVSGGTPGGSDVGLIPGGSAPDAAVTISL